MEDQERYQIGKREEAGRYPVTVDETPAGHIYRRHGSWYAVMPGHPTSTARPDRYAAAAELVRMVDQGQRPTVPTQAPAPTSPLQPIPHELYGYAHLMPDLRLTLPNLVRAAEAMARLDQLGWTPLAGYPGADQPWLMWCQLCGWEGYRFWSHLRGRNGDAIPRPITRHPGCIPVAKHKEELSNLAAARTFE